MKSWKTEISTPFLLNLLQMLAQLHWQKLQWQLGSSLHQNINTNYVSFLTAKSGHSYSSNYLLIQYPCRLKNIYLLWKELCFSLSGVYLKLQYITELLLHQVQHSILAHKIHHYDKKKSSYYFTTISAIYIFSKGWCTAHFLIIYNCHYFINNYFSPQE